MVWLNWLDIHMDILLPRLESEFGIVGSVALWIHSYQTDRKLRRHWCIEVSCVEVSWRRPTHKAGFLCWHRDCRWQIHHSAFHTLEEWPGHGRCKSMKLQHSRSPPHPSVTDQDLRSNDFVCDGDGSAGILQLVATGNITIQHRETPARSEQSGSSFAPWNTPFKPLLATGNARIPGATSHNIYKIFVCWFSKACRIRSRFICTPYWVLTPYEPDRKNIPCWLL